MKSKDLLVGKGGSEGSPSSPKAMRCKDLLVGKGGPMAAPVAQSNEIQGFAGWQRGPRC